MAEFDYQWKYTLNKEDLENEEDKFECNEKRVKEFLNQFKNKGWSFRKPSFKGKVCLDAGCGPGRWTCALQKLNAARVDSFDLSSEAVVRCKKINPNAYIFDIMKLERPVASPSNSNSTIVPQPSNDAPVTENPSTVVSLAESINPAASASPPETLIIEAPSTSNWKPAIAEDEL